MQLPDIISGITIDTSLLLSNAIVASEEKYFTIYRNDESNLYVLTYFESNQPKVVNLNSFEILSSVQVINLFSYSNLGLRLSKFKIAEQYDFIRKTPSININKVLPLYFNLVSHTDLAESIFSNWLELDPTASSILFLGASQEEYYLLSSITVGKKIKKTIPNILIQHTNRLSLTNKSTPFLYYSPGNTNNKLHLHFAVTSFNRKSHYDSTHCSAIIHGHGALDHLDIENHQLIFYYHPHATTQIIKVLIDLFFKEGLIEHYFIDDNQSIIILHFILNNHNAGDHANLENELVDSVFNYQSSQWNQKVSWTPVEKDNFKDYSIRPMIRRSTAHSKGLTLAIPKSPEFFIPIINSLLNKIERKATLQLI